MTIAKVFGLALTSLASKKIDYVNDTVKCALLNASYTPDQDVHQYVSQLSHELSGGGYARVSLSTKTLSYDTGTNTLTFDCDDLAFPALTSTTIRYAVIFIDTGVAGTSPLLGYVDFEADQSVTAATFAVVIPVTGIVQIAAA